MAADAKIVSLYGLPSDISSPLCDEASCVFFVDFLSKFHLCVNENHSSHPWVTTAELDTMGYAAKVLQLKEHGETIKWIADYGCALLLKSDAGYTAGMVDWNLISLDLHRFDTKSKLASNEYEYVDSARAMDYEVLHIGTSKADEVEQLQSKFQALLATAQTRSGSQRSSHGGSRQGHQKTPAFIHAIYRETFGQPNQTPRGGFTDVGLHTGGQERDTAWPLVCAAFFQVLRNHASGFSPDMLFSKIIAYFGLYVTQVTIEQYKKNNASIKNNSNAPNVLLDYGYRILRSASLKASSLSDEGLEMNHFVVWSANLRDEILQEASIRSSLYSKSFELPDTNEGIWGTYRDYRLKIPIKDPSLKDTVVSESVIHKLTLENLRWVNVLDEKSLAKMSVWAKKEQSKAKHDSLKSILVLKTIENAMWDCAKDLSKTLGQEPLEQVSSIIDSYRSVLHDFMSSSTHLHLSTVELRSREVLVVWVAFCIIHSNTVWLHKAEMAGFGVPLDFNNLSHLVLSNPVEWEVVLQVSKYLKNFGNSRPIFSLKEEQFTFEMGKRIANASLDMDKIWNQEEHDAKCRVEGHWKEVLRKQDLAKTLRSEISDLECNIADTNYKLAPKRRELQDHEELLRKKNHRYASRWDLSAYDADNHTSCEGTVISLSSALSQLCSRLSSKQSKLKNALQAPTPVFQPLPSDKNAAMAVIFFLYMPPTFQLLSKFSFTAQQLMLPKPWANCWGGENRTEKVDIRNQVHRGSDYCSFSWTEYYNRHHQSVYHQTTRKRSGSDFYLRLRSMKDSVPKEVGHKTVDYISSKDDGVWYPDSLNPRMSWFGGPLSFDQYSGHEINPFAQIDHFCLVSNFTERFGREASTLQWALVQPGDGHIGSSRGNIPYAIQHSKPTWLSKSQFLSFTSMRSHPRVQLRNILVAIQNRDLPFEEQAVHILINQTLFHIGKVTNDLKLEWKRDLYDLDCGQDAHSILHSFYEEIAESPKRYKCVKLLGKLCNFFSNWEHECRNTARLLAKSACSWADELEPVIKKSPPSDIPSIRSNQVVLYQQAIVVLVNGVLDQPDAALLIKMIVQSRNFFTDGNRLDEINANDTEVKYLTSQRIDDILRIARLYPEMLSEALRSVVPRCPDKLIWEPWCPAESDYTQCFKAKGKDGIVYCMNVITGDVLINGLPPSRLPASILDHPLYKRVFGNRNHEVANKGDFLETVRPVCDRYYRFSIQGSNLKINEFQHDESEMLELLDGTTDGVNNWGSELPGRLKSMHSHWLFREEQVIVLRGIRFNERDVSFLIKLNKECTTGQVKCIEQHCDDRKQLLVLLQKKDNDTLVFHKSAVVDILAKIEKKDFIYSLISASSGNNPSQLKFFLPRYKLTFLLDKNVLRCQEVSGYQMSRCQQIDGTLRGTSSYLVLEQAVSKSKLLICPKGRVVRVSPGNVNINVNGDYDVELILYKYTWHPRFHYLETKQSCASRMQLVALHLATSYAIPDEILHMTGEERAAALIRQTWSNRPLNEDECGALNNIKDLAKGASPTLSLLCRDVKIGADQFHFLHHYDPICEDIDCSEASAYLNYTKTRKIGYRCYLTEQEESRLFGVIGRKATLPPRFASNQSLLKGSITNKEVELLQTRLTAIRSKLERAGDEQKPDDVPFPLDTKPASALEIDITNELKDSWDAHVESRKRFITLSIDDGCFTLFEGMMDEVVCLRKKAEKYSLDALNSPSRERVNWHDNAHDMLRIAGVVPTATVCDLAKIAIEPAKITDFNPMLTKASKKILLKSISIWLRLCVYEDKLTRLISFSQSRSMGDVLRELETVTIWNTEEHPAWLVFEVENRLQIRQVQYKVTQHLIDNPGDVMQLNMGLGKTRVILPMLVMHWSFGKRNKVTRLNFLSALFDEAYKYLHDHLCASLLGIRFFTMPFNRDVKLNVAAITTMKKVMDNCRVEGGALVVAPEHRLSLELKHKELYSEGESNAASELQKFIHKDMWRDILDECDELLKHPYQLIYAIGSATSLPQGAHRWRAIQAIFTTLALNKNLTEFLIQHPKACSITTRSIDKWPSIYFFEGSPLDSMLQELIPMLANAIVSNPPYELIWMRNHSLSDDIITAIIHKETCPPTLESLPKNYRHDILALRGFLAGDILRHCLLKRHRVNFGIARPGKKQLAIPFRFADTPAERSEFAHPDCALGLTVLAYYYDGLTRPELRQSFGNLMSLGENAQRKFYNEWFELSSNPMKSESSDCFETLNCIEKIDTSNEIQMEKLWHFFHRNMLVINFYLNTQIFPVEMDQFSQRLTATSWNLAQNPSGHIIGFSGTNDNHRILPLQVRQYFPSSNYKPDTILQDLFATNGHMLEMILKNTIKVCNMKKESHGSHPLIDEIKYSIKGSTVLHAIIDCGAILAGINLKQFSQSVLNILPVEDFGGVLFYDGTDSLDWVVLERSGRCLPKDISPIQEVDSFVIFDEPRCRGTDLKLRSKAVALLTLAPNLCKDKLMQAAGRLRKLGQSQKLIMVGGSDVFSKLRDVVNNNQKSKSLDLISSMKRIASNNLSQFTPAHVLSWAMKNTVDSNVLGTSNWANQGLFFASTFGKDPKLSITDELLELEDFYGNSFNTATVKHIIDKATSFHMKRTGGMEVLNIKVKDIVETIHMRVDKYGSDFTLSASGCDEECERELAMEVEIEEECEIEIQLMTPASEKNWDFNSVFSASSPTKLPISVHSLKQFVKCFIQLPSLAQIKWPSTIYCTENFAQTIVRGRDASSSFLNNYLRVVDFVLYFPSGEFLLLSSYEANALLKLFWDHNARGKHLLMNFTLLRRAIDESTEIILACTTQRKMLSRSIFNPTKVRLDANDIIGNISMASLQLFAGEATYSTEERREALKSILRVKRKGKDDTFCPQTVSEEMLEMRGKGNLFSYSDLEKICVALLCEIE